MKTKISVIIIIALISLFASCCYNKCQNIIKPPRNVIYINNSDVHGFDNPEFPQYLYVRRNISGLYISYEMPEDMYDNYVYDGTYIGIYKLENVGVFKHNKVLTKN